MRGLPATTPQVLAFCRSDLRSLDSAVQSRVGDGFLAVRSDGAIRKRNPVGLPVFPSTKFAVNVRGSEPAVDDDVAAAEAAAPGLTRKKLSCRQNAHARTAVGAHLDRERSLKYLFE